MWTNTDFNLCVLIHLMFQVHFTTITSGLKLLMEIVKCKARGFSWNFQMWTFISAKLERGLQPNHYIINCLNSLYIVLVCTVRQKIWICFFLNHHQNVVFIEKLHKIYKKNLILVQKEFSRNGHCWQLNWISCKLLIGTKLVQNFRF